MKKPSVDTGMIRQMLDAAEYVEGEAIAVVKNEGNYTTQKTLSVVDGEMLDISAKRHHCLQEQWRLTAR